MISCGFGEEFLTEIRATWRFPAIEEGSNRRLIPLMPERHQSEMTLFQFVVGSGLRRKLASLSDRRFVNADAAFLNNSEGTPERLGFQRADQGGEKTTKDFLAHAGGCAQHGDAMMFGRREAERVGEVQIQRDDAALIGTAAGGDLLIRGGAKVLLRHGADVMPDCCEQVPAP